MGIPTEADTGLSARIGLAFLRTAFLAALGYLLCACTHHPAPTRAGAALTLDSLPGD